jgi:hypothetical protein
MQTWEFLPAPLRTLEPYDRIFCQPCIGAAERSAACPCCTAAAPRRDSDEGYDSSESDGVPVKPVKPVKKEEPAHAVANGASAAVSPVDVELAVVPSASADELV